MSKKKPDAPEAIKPSAGERDYESEGHLRTLLDAEMIKQDPNKMAKIHKLASGHQKAITSIQQLRQIHQEKYGAGAKKSNKVQSDNPEGDDSDLGT
jgi:hypothetical protein